MFTRRELQRAAGPFLRGYLDNPSESMQQSIAVAVAEAVSLSGKEAVRPCLERLLSMYEEAKTKAEV